MKTEEEIRRFIEQRMETLMNGASYRPEFYAYSIKQLEVLKWVLGEVQL